MSKIKVAVVEDHEKFRKTFINFLKSENDIEIIIEAENGSALLDMLKEKMPDVILLDIQMPIMDGFEVVKILQLQYPHIKIIVFTQFDNEANIINMLKLGINSFVSKNQAERVPTVIKIVYNGGSYYPDEIAAIIQSNLNTKPVTYDLPNALSDLEMTILHCICNGMSSTDIGSIINKSHRTVEKYRDDLYKKFNVTDKKQLIQLVSEHRLLRN